MTRVTRRRPVLDGAARVVAIILAILLIGIPVVLMLMAYGILPPDDVNAFTGYRGLLRQVAATPGPGLNVAELWVGIVAVVVALGALVLLLLVLFYRPIAKTAVVQSDPGKETALRPRAVRHLAEGAALSAGAESADIDVRTRRDKHDVWCGFQTSEFTDVPGLARRVHDGIRRELEEAGVKVGKVQTVVRGRAPSEMERERVK